MFGICGKINVEKKKMENMFDMINLFIFFFLKDMNPTILVLINKYLHQMIV